MIVKKTNNSKKLMQDLESAIQDLKNMQKNREEMVNYFNDKTRACINDKNQEQNKR